MELRRVFEAMEDALRNKDYMIDAYKTENERLRAQVKELTELLNGNDGGRENAE